MRFVSRERVRKMLLILPKKMPEEIFSCNKQCFCVDYFDFSKKGARIKYRDCFQEFLDKRSKNELRTSYHNLDR